MQLSQLVITFQLSILMKSFVLSVNSKGTRSSIAILNGKESIEDLKLLSKDILTYFGFGCRSITKIYVHINMILLFSKNFKREIRIDNTN